MAISNTLYFPAMAGAGRAAATTSPAGAATSAGAATTVALSDTYTPSAGQSSLGVLSPRQALAMKAQNKPAFTDKDLMAAVVSHDYSKLVEQMSNMPRKRDFVAKFAKSHPEEYAALVKDIRAGKVSSPSLKVAVALETLNGTKWARTPEGARIAAHLGKLYDQGKVTSMEDPGGLGRTDIIGEGTGRDGSKADSRVIVRQDLLDSPEAVATVLAHEGQHSYRASIGAQKRSLHEEVDAHSAQNAVWGEFGEEKYASAAQQKGGSLDQTAAYDTEQKLYNHLASTYVQDYVDKGARGAARGMIVDYMDYSRKNDFNPSRNLSDDDLKSLVANGQALVGKKSSEQFVNAVDDLQGESENRRIAEGV
jgi:hypothetical protein